jgi:zinc protease
MKQDKMTNSSTWSRLTSRCRILNLTGRSVFALLIATTLFGCSTNHPIQSPPNSGLEPTNFIPVEPISWVAPNGATVFYLPDEELPLVSLSVAFPGGSYRARSPMAARVMGALLRRGGAGEMSRDAIDQELRERSASIETSADGEAVSVSINCLKGDEGRVVALARAMIEHPTFSQEEFSLMKKQMREQVIRRRDDPDTIAGLVFGQLLYGSRSPYSDAATVADINALSKETIISEHRRLLSPSGAIVAISGALSREEVERLVEQLLGGLPQPQEEIAQSPFPAVKGEPRPGVYFIEGPFSQATILIGHLGVPRLSPDLFDILVFNDIFGSGSMSSRLFAEVRTKRGLAYVAAGGISPGVVKGKNYLYAQTKSSSVGEAIDASVGVLTEMQKGAPQLDEVSDRKRAITNSFVFANQSPSSIVSRRATFKLQGYPADYDSHFLNKLATVTPLSVQQVAQKRWDLSDLVVVVVGDKAARESLANAHFLKERTETSQRRIPITDLTFREIGAGPGIRR